MKIYKEYENESKTKPWQLAALFAVFGIALFCEAIVEGLL